MKTTQELNSKWWYRLLKVVFIPIGALVAVATGVGIYFANEPQGDYLISCLYGNQTMFLAERDAGLHISPAYVEGIHTSSFMPDWIKTRLQDECGMTREEKAELFVESIRQIRAGGASSNYWWTVTASEPGFSDYLPPLAYSLLGFLSVVLLFEGARRSFYYIVLGSFVPSR